MKIDSSWFCAVLIACMVPALSASAQDGGPARGFQLHVDGISAFPTTDLSLKGYEKSDMETEGEEAMRPTLGGYLGASYPIMDWFAIEAGAALLFFRTEAMESGNKDREQLVDVLARPKFRYVVADGFSEVYVTAPAGVSLPLGGDGLENLADGALKANPGFTVGGAVGGYYFFRSRVGIHYEMGYQHHQFSYDIDRNASQTLEFGKAPKTLDVKFGSVNMTLGVAYGF